MKLEQIVRDLDDGLISVYIDGRIRVMNPRAVELLDVEESYAGKHYSELADADELNTKFHQLFYQAAEDGIQHKQKIRYRKQNGKVEYFDVTCSVIWNKAHDKREGVVLVFNDCTESEALKEKIKDSSAIFLLFITLISLWVFVVMTWVGMGKPFRGDYLSKALVLLLFIPVPFIQHLTNFSLSDFGLTFKWKYLLQDAVVTVGLILMMCLIKLVMLNVMPEFFDNPAFVIWDKYPASEYLMYIVSVIAQEFITRGVVHETMDFVVESSHKETLSIIVSSLIFGAMHLHLGITYMVSASFLLGALGMIYNKQRSIWGLCIPHYVLGMLLGLLGFVIY